MTQQPVAWSPSQNAAMATPMQMLSIYVHSVTIQAGTAALCPQKLQRAQKLLHIIFKKHI
eukprot:5453014-Amphidinium_carterae.1